MTEFKSQKKRFDFTFCLHDLLLPRFDIMERIWDSQTKEISSVTDFTLIEGNFSTLSFFSAE